MSNKLYKQIPDLTLDYNSIKLFIESARLKLSTEEVQPTTLSNIFEFHMVELLITYWSNPIWYLKYKNKLFTPEEDSNQYFMAKILQDSGIIIDKFAFSKLSSLNKARTLAINTSFIELQNTDAFSLSQYIEKELDKGLYYMGYNQNETSFLLKLNFQVYIIYFQSNKGLIIGDLERLNTISLNHAVYITELSTNQTLLNYWINQKEVKIIRE